jgi:hypothetical protein
VFKSDGRIAAVKSIPDMVIELGSLVYRDEAINGACMALVPLGAGRLLVTVGGEVAAAGSAHAAAHRA